LKGKTSKTKEKKVAYLGGGGVAVELLDIVGGENRHHEVHLIQPLLQQIHISHQLWF
jgi:hypothetical protein